MRYFIELAYNGANYYGWQRQPREVSVQSTLEDAFSTILGTPTAIHGCGRTDTGVHARQYFAHFDFTDPLPKSFTQRLNKFLPPDIAIYRIFEVAPEAHARFDAHHRAYEYLIDFRKNPFGLQTSYYFPFAHQLDFNLMQQAGKLLMQYDEFFPFCKTNTDVKTMQCDLRRAEWVLDEERQQLVFHIAANRFLRGMVRLIVGMSLNVGLQKTSLKEVREAMDQQTRLKRSLSVPPQGLYLKDIRYEYVEAV